MHTNVYAVCARGCSLSNMSSGYDLRARLKNYTVTIPRFRYSHCYLSLALRL